MRKKFITALILVCISSSANADFEKGLVAYAANDIPLAFEEFSSAAEDGDPNAQFNLGLMHEQGLGTQKNDEKALVWYKKSATLGNMFAQYNVGVFYENGKGTEVDFAQANAWYRKAVLQGDGLATGNLGMLYLRGDGVAENKQAALALLIMSTSLDSSAENVAKRNISLIRGLTPAMVTAAQTLSNEMIDSTTPLTVLDNFLAKP
ncbi:tetratricopeptide repeat protein [Paraglaciecola aquimarina]|uniref:Tetratricopeptide repeat protein n=1 Tax=Paraglaciecola aquimarina TaxID=1235557 RepID=A0ABU3SYE5_9ALTE|nr:tetratricopeptide repeat protein [Paraglaciecola aquimarina]MDU0355021.1 tetratricopeptide repeat protein [Paraglaciecola aquimarina]